MPTEEVIHLTDVWEVHGRPADIRGWDYMVCRSLGDALGFVQGVMEDAEPDEKITVIFRQYTDEQLADVVVEP